MQKVDVSLTAKGSNQAIHELEPFFDLGFV
jgi:hypothetical protein